MSGPEVSSELWRDDIVTLIGYRGCGKSTVGRQLAQRLGWEFIDTDERIEQQAGCTIREIFERDGEAAFRKLEIEVLENALAGTRRVIAAGGGAVLARRNRKAMRSSSACIWLTAPPDELLARLSVDDRTATQRPSLTGDDALEEIEAVLFERLPVYEATADHVISTAGQSIDAVVEAVLDYLRVGERRTDGA